MSQIRLILITICLLSSILNNRTNAEEIHEQIIAERIAKALKIGIEDDIWFNGEHSSYYFLNAQELQYEYTYDGYKDHATVLFAEENQDNTINFYMLDLPANNGIFTNEIYESIFYNDPLDYEELKKKYIPGLTKLGKIRIEATDKPKYNASQAQIEEATHKIMAYFNENFLIENITDIYIRNFYDVSESTVIVYCSGDTRCFAYAALSGRVYKPTPADDEIYDDYIQRILECSYSVN